MFAIIVLLFVLWLVVHRITNRRKIQLAAGFPGPFNFPVIGNAWMFVAAKPEGISFTNKL